MQPKTMGIPKFYGNWIVKKYRECTELPAPTSVHTVNIDLNAMIHPAMAEARDQRAADVVNTLKMKLREIYRKYNPRYLNVFVDGIPSVAKMVQQRTRRFISKKLKRDESYDSNSITPGTQMMYDIDSKLRDWFSGFPTVETNEGSQSVPSIYYSPYTVRGEGEHKMVDHLLEMKDKSGAHIIYGMDADLILLSLRLQRTDDNLKGLERVYLVKEDDKRSERLDIECLATNLTSTLGGRSGSIRDFIFLVNLMGNDFIPKTPGFRQMGGTLDAITKLYRESGLSIVDATGAVDYESFLLILGELIDTERDMLESEADIVYGFPDKELNEIYKMEETARYDNFFNYRDWWYYNALGPRGEVTEFEVEVTSDRLSNGMNKMCMEYITGMIWTYTLYLEGAKSIDQTWYYPYRHAPFIYDMYYALQNEIKKNTTGMFLTKEKPNDCHMLTLLFSVLPSSSENLVPAATKWLFGTGNKVSEFRYLYPSDFPIDHMGTNEDKEHAGIPMIRDLVAILPFVEVDHLDKQISMKITTETRDSARFATTTPYTMSGAWKGVGRGSGGRGESRYEERGSGGRGGREERGSGGRGEERGSGGRGGYSGGSQRRDYRVETGEAPRRPVYGGTGTPPGAVGEKYLPRSGVTSGTSGLIRKR